MLLGSIPQPMKATVSHLPQALSLLRMQPELNRVKVGPAASRLRSGVNKSEGRMSQRDVGMQFG